MTAWLRSEGDQIAEFESLLEVNTDKVDTEIPSPATGTLLRILIPANQTVEAGTILAWIGDPGEEVPEGGDKLEQDHEPHETPDAESITDEPVMLHPGGRDDGVGYISPVVARLARENSVDLGKVKRTGLKGRITKQDILAYVEEH